MQSETQVKPFLLVLVIFILLTMSACKKASFTPVKVTYIVKVKDGNKVSINYNSDYYFETGTMQPLEFTSNGITWYANHIAEEPEDYYIKVDYLNAPNAEDNFKVQVYFNDTMQVASSINDTVVPQVILQGRVGN